ncbi:RsmB/NOP family class I SAM-dependent RNA methyltransferase [Nocardioides sp. zg-1228]|uniref:RsmB/NOP family class I SAM-dependent RNA methyltransferase n=1 Tax=Nocardioides sp. zg-1228 TaxID=2763008 RepID=UPI00164269BB|nr:transcription antitermination factor NusB [Nocardioides sp. zg-1228]MBC2934555.1 rRNA cytosine-C5-methyltransferase [Nocardioides sp. zg-1228]QSF59310.1 rRNA cytosine-C5-methyltransferase [Nocardioides sp. zg-1228]
MTSRRRPVDKARRAALDVLTAVRVDDAYANLVLPQVLRKHGLDGRDAGLATELASGAIRMHGLYDAVIDACLTRPRLQPEVRDVLRLGTHQLLSMRVPDHAAISTSVDLVRASVGQGPAGLVNAVLRTVSRRDLAGWVAEVAPDAATDPHGHLAVARSHPRWVVDALAEALGSDDELDALLEADNAAPRVTLVARPGLASVEELEAAGGTRTGRSPYAVTLTGGDPGAVPAVAEGRAGVQDEGSQLVAIALADAPLEGRDSRWLDLCAGPGGKSALLGALAARRGAVLLANERQPHRAALVASALRALPDGTAHVVAGDGVRPAWVPGTFDRVLVDAPCSGLGALRRRPESRWRRRPDDVAELAGLQQALLDAALESVRPGGVVVYATCSPVVAETTEVVRSVLARRADADEVDRFQLWPHRDGTDAMFASTLRRRAWSDRD